MSSVGIVFRDLFALAALTFLLLVVLMLAHLRPPAENADVKAPGSLMIELRWPDEHSADVDLWVQSPGDRPVGYRRKNGLVFDLLRDDLGNTRDQTLENFEFAFSRGAPAGEYAVNVHLFSGSPPVDVVVVVSLRRASGVTRIGTRRLTLSKLKQEITVMRFRLGADGRLVPGSVHDLPLSLRGSR